MLMGGKRKKGKKKSMKNDELEKEEEKFEDKKEEPKIEKEKKEEVKEGENQIHINKEEEEEKEGENQIEIINKKCSLDEHKEIDAILYCQECKINMCLKCEKVHSSLLKNHHIYSLEKETKEIFTGLCTNRQHSLELEFYCKTHNELCCAACISKIKINGKGQHNNCEIYHITKIKNDIKQK